MTRKTEKDKQETNRNTSGNRFRYTVNRCSTGILAAAVAVVAAAVTLVTVTVIVMVSIIEDHATTGAEALTLEGEETVLLTDRLQTPI